MGFVHEGHEEALRNRFLKAFWYTDNTPKERPVAHRIFGSARGFRGFPRKKFEKKNCAVVVKTARVISEICEHKVVAEAS